MGFLDSFGKALGKAASDFNNKMQEVNAYKQQYKWVSSILLWVHFKIQLAIIKKL